jgi:uncharacterized protein (TIGR03437 family)
LSIVRSTVDLAPANTSTSGVVSETIRSPALPIELNGVSVSVNGAAAGLYFVGNSPQQINFVMPIGLFPNAAANVVINNNGTVLRAQIPIVAVQPDIFSSTMDAGGRAKFAFNVTNPMQRTPEPFKIKSDDGSGNQVATVLEIGLTGVRFATASAITITIGDVSITGANFVGPNREMPGFDIITFALPDTVKPGDVPIIVSTNGASSRSADSAPHITIIP